MNTNDMSSFSCAYAQNRTNSKSFLTSETKSFYTANIHINPNILVDEDFIMQDNNNNNIFSNNEFKLEEIQPKPFTAGSDIFDKKIQYDPKFFDFHLVDKRYKVITCLSYYHI